MWRAAALGALFVFLGLNGLPSLLGQNHRWNLLAVDYGRNIFRTVPPDAVLLMISDAAIFAADHARYVDRKRTDLNVLVDADLPWRWRQYRRLYPELFEAGQSDGGKSLVQFQSRQRAVFTEGFQQKFLESLCPFGMTARVEWPRRTDRCLNHIEETAWIWEIYTRRVPASLVLLNDYYSRGVLQTVSAGAFNAGLLLSQSDRHEAGLQLYSRALFWNPDRLLRWSEAFAP